MTTTATLHTEIRSLGRCQTCGTVHLFIGSTFDRNGQVCVCTEGRLAHFTAAKGLARGVVKFRKVRGTRTDHPCDEACTSAKTDACACVCGGDNHGAIYHGGW